MFGRSIGRQSTVTARGGLSVLAALALLALLLLPAGLVNAASPMTITNVDSPDPVQSGSQILYTITVTNTGGAKVSNAVLTDQYNGLVGFGNPPLLDAVSSRGSCTQNNTQVTCDGGTIEGGGVWTVTIRGNVSAAGGTTINNNATVTATKSAQTFTNSASATTQVEGTLPGGLSPDLTIGKNGPLSAAAGGPMTYTLTVNNIGTATATGVKVTDTLPTGFAIGTISATSLFQCSTAGQAVSCEGGQVNAGANATITIAGTASTAGTLTNTAVVDPDNTIDEGILGDTQDYAERNNNSNTVTTSVSPTPPPPAGPITITKERIDGPNGTPIAGGQAVPGSLLYYRLTVTNGTLGRADYITLTDTTQGLQAASLTVLSAVSSGGTTPACTVAAPIAICTMTRLPVNGTLTAEIRGMVVASAGSTIINNATVTANIKNAGYSATDQVQTIIKPGYDLTITKADSPDPVCANSWPGPAAPGVCRATDTPSAAKPKGGLAYSFVVSNSGILAAADVVVRDVLPSGVTYDSAVTPAGWSCANASNTITCHGPLGAESSVTLHFLTVAPATTGTITNTVNVDPGNAVFESDETNNVATETTTISTGIDLTIAKFDAPPDSPKGFDPIATSGTQTYLLVIDDIGTQDATNIRVRDSLPAGTIFRSAQEIINPVAAVGDTALNGFTCSYSAGVVECINGHITGTASESYFGLPPGPKDSATIEIRVFAQPNVGTGSSGMHNEARVDPLNEIPEADENNNLAIQDTDVGSYGEDHGAFNQLTIAKAQTSPVLPAAVATNGTLTYTLTIGNDGSDPAVNVSVRDFLPVGSRFISAVGDRQFLCTSSGIQVDCTGGNIPAHAVSLPTGQATITIKAFAPNTPGTYPNTALVDPGNAIPEGNEFDNTASVATPVASGGANAFNELSITKTDSPDPVATSSVETYTIVVTNNGSDPAFQVRVRDFLPAGFVYVQAQDSAPGPKAFFCSLGGGNVLECSGATINGGGASRTITVTTFASAVPGNYTNLALVDPDNAIPEGDETNNAAQETTKVQVGPSDKYIDLTLAKTDSPDPVTPGGTITYTLTVQNTGTNPAFNVLVRDYLPPGTTLISVRDVTDGAPPTPPGPGSFACSQVAGVVDCTGGTLDGSDDLIAGIGSTRLIQLKLSAPLANVDIVNNATVDPLNAIPEGNETNNNGSADTQVRSRIDLTIEKTGPTSASQNSTDTYELTVHNVGADPAFGVVVEDRLPVGLIPLLAYASSPNTTDFTCQILENPINVVRCVGTLDGTDDSLTTFEDTVKISIKVFITAESGTLDNEACVDPDNTIVEIEDNLNNCSTASTAIGVPDLAINKTADVATATPGQNVVYTLLVSNNGDGPTTAPVTVTDTLPTGLTLVSASGTNGFTCGTTSPVTCTDGGGNHPVGQITTITVTATVTATSGPLENKADVSHDPAEPPAADTNNHASHLLNIGGTGVDLVAVTYTDLPDPVPQGDSVTYTAVITNAGASNATAVKIQDVFSTLTGMTLVSATASQGFSCALASLTVECNGNLGAGQTTTVKIVFQTDSTAPASVSSTVTVDPGPPLGGTIPETNESNNALSQVTTISNAICSSCVDLVMGDVIETPDPVKVGNNLVYTITVGNVGDQTTDTTASPDLLIFFDLVGDFTLVNRTASNGITCATDGTTTPGVDLLSNCTGELGPGQGTVITITVTPNSSGTISATAFADPTGPYFGPGTIAEFNESNNGPASESTTVNP